MTILGSTLDHRIIELVTVITLLEIINMQVIYERYNVCIL